MTIFASETQSDQIPVPGDAGHTVVVRKLTGIEIEAAQQAHANGIAAGGARTWAARFRRMLEHGGTDTETLQAIADPLTGYDRFALVRAGLVSWSYPRSVKPVLAKPAIAAKGSAPASPPVAASDAIADLDDEAVDFIATEVLRLTKPALFLTSEEDVEQAQKKLSAAAPCA